MTTHSEWLALFDPDTVDDETRSFNDRLEGVLASAPSILDVTVREAREARVSGASFLGPVVRLPGGEDRTIEGPSGPLKLRVFRPARTRGAFLHIHGGGWALGSEDQQDALLDALSEATGLAVVSVGYRLAPEHPWPAAADDCEAAARWLIRNVEIEFGGSLLAIGGESAGAHLSVVTLLRLRDRRGVSSFSAAALSYGVYDLTLTPSARSWGKRNLVLSTPIIERYVDWFVPNVEMRAHPEVSPLYADLRGMPPAIFTVGTLDPLLDDTLFMSSRWQTAGNRVSLEVVPGGAHAFNAFPIGIARRANQRIADFLVRELPASASLEEARA